MAHGAHTVVVCIVTSWCGVLFVSGDGVDELASRARAGHSEIAIPPIFSSRRRDAKGGDSPHQAGKKKRSARSATAQ